MPRDDRFHIPSELMEFVKKDTYSLLIKGGAGTGKTTLALSILKILGIKDNFQYISARVSPEQLCQYFPWIVRHFNIPERPAGNDEDNDSEIPIFVDARLDEPSSMFERITNQLMDVGSPTIIIDTWDTVGYFMDKEALMNNARVLQTWRERARAKMIFISENPDDTTLDVLADGVVDLSQRYQNERLLRKITISKMRGVKVNRTSYKFTLNNAMFRSFEPYNPSDFTTSRVPKPIKTQATMDGGFIKNVSPQLEAVVGGGFPSNSVVNIGFDSNVNWKVVLSVISQMISNFVAAGNHVICQCSQMNADYLSDYLKVTKTKNEKNVVFVNQQKNRAKTNSMASLVKKIKSKSGRLILSVVFSDALPTITKEIYSINRTSDLTIIVNVDSRKDVENNLSKNADMSVLFLEVNGTLFMQSNIPWSHFFAVVLARDGEQSHIALEPIV